ncbi:diguanylate cyclase (GGDEF)-like protein/PAS domain S-box-containing protein [Methylohalomonas lacus]|uniref:Diguanylate cyclase (GGDEF)-like protein/PAS domain S-box-containing protein n=1 Tax=Methylohalomonas lacus TaxID=398773 RepID=A0AAE3HN36_9GAMM|nr:EAL domain-containing protein [Methylohalomonas lacus]MCS3904282.1 diguanylate cyclase (GGDEF)-like protein/PAS domain S-box-containing protein [Methylohalomonas lacus]
MLALLLFSVLTWFTYQAIDRELTRSAFADHRSTARLAAATLNEKFERLTSIGVAVASESRFRELAAAGEWQRAISILKPIPREFAFIERLVLTDPDGTETADTPALKGGVGNNFAFRDWYQGVSRDWEPYVSHVYERTARPTRKLFAVAIPIRHDAGDVLGILVLQIELDDFFSWVRDMDVGTDGFVYVVDSRGRLGHHPAYPDQGDIIDFSSVPIVRKAMQGEGEIDIGPALVTGEEQLSAYAPVAHGWGIVVQQPTRIAFAYRNQQLTWVLAGYGLVLAFALLIALLLLRILRQRMQASENRRFQEELEEQWTFFRKVMDIDRNMIFVKDDQGRFVLVNQAVADVFGTTVENMVGKTNSDFIPSKALVDKFHQDEQEVIQNKREKHIPEVFVRDNHGKDRWLQVIMRPITSVDGSRQMVLGVSSDITKHVRMEAELRNNIERFEIIARSTSDAIWDWDMSSDSLWWNESFSMLFGYRQEEIEWSIDFWKTLIHPDDRDRVVNGIEAAIAADKEYWQDEYRFLRKDGSYAYVRDHGYIIRNEQNEAYRMLGSLADITERRAQEEKITRLSRIREILSEINYAIVHMRDRELLLQEACRISVENAGFGLVWVGLLDDASQDIHPVAHHGESKGYLDSVGFSAHPDKREGQTITGQALRSLKPIVCNNVEIGDEVIYKDELVLRGYQSMAAFPILVDGHAIGTISFYGEQTDIFDREEVELLTELVADVAFALEYLDKEDKVKFLAYYDALTGLSNRDLFLDRLVQYLHSVDSNHMAGVVLMDIERFSSVNEVYGRGAGDDLLRTLSTRLREVVAETGYLARLGANIFAVFLRDIRDAADIANFIEHELLPQVSRPILIDTYELNISVRIGVAISPVDGSEAGKLVDHAEAALKNAKNSGDKYLFYTSDMNTRVADKLILENRLRKALGREEFVLFYQPKVDLSDNSICGFEALIRWNSDDGLVPPDRFILVLEETGLILDVGHWVIGQAMKDYQSWSSRGLNPPPIAVNISALQLAQTDFIERLDEIILQNATRAPWLDLEITETVIMEQLDENVQKLHAIRARGMGISIDDFGTGYSSLRYMSKLPVTALKIDRSFTANLLHNKDDTAIVTAVIPLAHSLNLKVVAEGVETNEQLNLLRELKCDQFQGYLFNPPLPADAVETLLREYRPGN